MFDIRKIQESVIYHAVKNESDDETARKIVNGDKENNATWVKNTSLPATTRQRPPAYLFAMGSFTCSSLFVRARCLPKLTNWKPIPGANVQQVIAK